MAAIATIDCRVDSTSLNDKVAILMEHTLALKGFTFEQLFTAEGLHKLDEAFLARLQQVDSLFHGQLLNYRRQNHFSPEQVSELIIQCGPVVEAFIANLFGIEDAAARLQAVTLTDDPIFAFKKYFCIT